MRLRLALGVFPECRLGGGEAGDRHAERRAGDVIEPDLVAEGDRGGIAAVLAADAELENVASLATARDRDSDQLADALAIERDEGIDRQNAFGRIRTEEARRVVAA